MVEQNAPDEQDYLADYRIGVDFIVGARNMAEARALVEQMLATENSDGIPFATQRHRRIEDGRSWGISGWASVPPRPSQAALVQARYPDLAGNIAIVDALRELLGTAGRGVLVDELIPEATKDRILTMLDAVNPVVRVEDPEDSGYLLFEGEALDAAAHLSEGVYRAFDHHDREFGLVVAPSDLTPLGRVSAALPRDLHDSCTLDEIAAILRAHDPNAPLPELVDRINRRLETTHRHGLPPESHLDDQNQHAQTPSYVSVGVIIWSNLEGSEPTVLVDTHPVRLARNVAETLHALLGDTDAFAGGQEFLNRHLPQHEWITPEDVDAWLDALQAESPYPAFFIQRLEVGARSPDQEPTALPLRMHPGSTPAAPRQGANRDTPAVSSVGFGRECFSWFQTRQVRADRSPSRRSRPRRVGADRVRHGGGARSTSPPIPRSRSRDH